LRVIESHIVLNEDDGQRLLDFCLTHIQRIGTKAGVKKAIKRQLIKVNDQDFGSGKRLIAGQRVDLCERDISDNKVFQLKLEIIYEDNQIAIINKPAGIEVSGNKYKTIQNALIFNLKPSDAEDKLNRPIPVHRLDYPTSGILVCAKTHAAAVDLGHQFQEKKVKKTYAAIVNGSLATDGIINDQLDSKDSFTRYSTKRTVSSLKAGTISLVSLFPETGRTHQLRRHLSGIGYPIVGDSLYSQNQVLLKGKGLFLSAIGIQFTHPVKQELMEFESEIPPKFFKLMEREEERFKKFEKT